MEFKQLNTFITISKLQSFTQAAESLGYAQSTITTQIKLLESELGVKLFERMGKNVTLTHEGKKLIPYAKQMIRLSAEVKNIICDKDVPTGSLTIGAAESLCVIRLPEILKEYRKLYPQVEVSMKFGSCAEFRHLICDNIIDVAFSLGSRLTSDDYIVEIEVNEPMMLLTAPGHRLIGKEKVYPEDLAGEPLILTETGCSYRAVFENILRQHNVKSNAVLETGSVQAIKNFTVSGLGVTLLPKVAVDDEISSGRLIPLNWAGPNFGIITQVLYHKDKWITPALRAFIDLSKKYICNDTNTIKQ